MTQYIDMNKKRKWLEQRRKYRAKMNPRVILKGNTYPYREEIKKHGGKWDCAKKVWTISQLGANIICGLFCKDVYYERNT
jgi:hypothetical protein